MISQIHRRSIPAVLGPLLVASTFACGPSGGHRNVTRLGDDLIIAGSSIYLQLGDSVPGDAILTARAVMYNSAIGGDYLGAGGGQTIAGRIHGSIRAAGGSITVTGLTDRNATIAGGNVVLDSTADIGRNAYLVGGTVQVNGTVRGSLLASGGTITLNGTVGRDVEIRADELRLGPRAVITGNLRYRVAPKKVHIESAARISGTVTALPVPSRWGLWTWLWPLGLLLAGAVAVALFPRFASEAAAILSQRPVRSALVGLVSCFLIPLAIILAAVTLVGIPLAIITGLVYLALAFVGVVPVAVWLGQRLLGARAREGRRGALLNFLVGGLLLLVVGLIPFIGGVITLIAGIFGFGAILLRARSGPEQQRV